MIEITEEERLRIDGQGWAEADLPEGLPPYVALSGRRLGKRYRLSQRADGACVFLQPDGLCRIHAKFGEPAKPLPCRMYPYVFHPAPDSVQVGARFSCPSVIRNVGKPIREQRKEIEQLARAVVPEGADRLPPPRISRNSRGTWDHLAAITNAALAEVSHARTPFSLRLIRLTTWITLLAEAQLDDFDTPRIRELISLLREEAAFLWPAVPAENPTNPVSPEDLPLPATTPDRLAETQFRQLAAYYTRKDTVADAAAGWWGRWQRLRTILSFTSGRGMTPALDGDWLRVPFSTIALPLPWSTPDAIELLTRYFQVKLESYAVCGPAFYGESLTSGICHLVLTFPVILWLARWRAQGRGSLQVESQDLEAALARVDHNHGYSEALGTRSTRSMIRSLMFRGQIVPLIVQQSRSTEPIESAQ